MRLVVAQLVNCVWLFAIPWTAVHRATLSFTISQGLPNSCPLSQWCYWTILSSAALFFCLQSFPVSGSSPVKALNIRWPKYWSFSFSISPSIEYSGLISFRIDWFHLLAVQGTLESLLQHHNSKTSVLQHATFFMVQLSHLHMTTGKTIVLTIWTFVGKVTSLLFNMLSRFVIISLPKIKRLLISWLQSPSTVILKSKKIKICYCFHFSPFYLHEVMEPGPWS